MEISKEKFKGREEGEEEKEGEEGGLGVGKVVLSGVFFLRYLCPEVIGQVLFLLLFFFFFVLF